MEEFYKLDNPIWYAISEAHQKYGIEYKEAKFYEPDYCAFGGIQNGLKAIEALETYSEQKNSFFIVSPEKPSLSNKLTLKQNLICNQMLFESKKIFDVNEEIVALQSSQQKENLFALIQEVQPGYFGRKTADLGRYFGIYKQGMLVAAAGERIQLDAFTEISGVVTLPEYRRKGYAKQLIQRLMAIILEDEKTPFLHVLSSNTGAIALYEKLGFFTRRKISFWHIEKHLPQYF